MSTDTTTPPRVAEDLANLADLFDKAPSTEVTDVTFVTGYITFHCSSAEEVDRLTAQWEVKATWSEDGTLYRNELNTDHANLTAVFFAPAGPVQA